MFDTRFQGTGDADLISAIGELDRAEAAAAAGRLSAIAELVRRRCDGEARAHWSCDEWDAAAAEISAELGISHGRAGGQMHLAMSLLRLPRIAALLLSGALSVRVVTAIVWRTGLVTDAGALALLDRVLAQRATDWGALSQYKLDQAIDTWIDRHDPGALRRTQASARSRDVTIGAENHEAGTASLWGRLLATDAAVLERTLTQMALGVCEQDPRTLGQRRADAMGALAAGSQQLTCQCAGPRCPAAGPDARAGSVVIHVLADEESLRARPDPRMSGDDCTAEPVAQPGSAVIVGGGVLPTPLLAELIRDGAKVRYLRKPPQRCEPRYRPSTALAEFVRMRDLTCRFPHCDKPAEYCDIDHAIPWPFGSTHPSNMRCLCRKHHLLKTFWRGNDGWRDQQSPDGTIVWTSPTGTAYVTLPGSRLLFPRWDTDTGRPAHTAAPPNSHHGLMMPTRRRTRAADRTRRIHRERALNDAHVAERNKPPPF